MRSKSSNAKKPAEQVVKDIRRATRRHFSAEDKIRIVLDGLRGEDSIAELCRKEGIAQSLYSTWSKEFMEAGKRRLAGETKYNRLSYPDDAILYDVIPQLHAKMKAHTGGNWKTFTLTINKDGSVKTTFEYPELYS